MGTPARLGGTDARQQQRHCQRSRRQRCHAIACTVQAVLERAQYVVLPSPEAVVAARPVIIVGGAEINLANADFTSPIEIEVVNVFGGTKLIEPSKWEIRSDVTAIFGGVDDKRHQPPNLVPEKVIILKGTLLFGGVEVTSF